MSKKFKVYDCFAFFNELDLLEIRLRTLNDVVDKFVLVEATRTFQKDPKPLYFSQNRERFKEFLPKIEHIVVNKFPGFLKKFRTPNPWDYDNSQKERIFDGLQSASPEDRVIISDLDEIPKPEAILENVDKENITVFRQRLYYYYLNFECTYFDAPDNSGAQKNIDGIGYWQGSVMMPFAKLKELGSIKKARLQRDKDEPQVHIAHDSGWHFAYLGGVKNIVNKLESYAHLEHNNPEYKNAKRLEERINMGKSIHDNSKFEQVSLDNRFPDYLLRNKEKFAKYIKT